MKSPNIYQIIDGFYDDPMGERAKALSANFKTEHRNGIKYENIALVDDEVHRTKLQRFGEIPGQKLDGDCLCYYRCNLIDQEEQTYIHSDVRIGVLTAVTYLVPNESCIGGTAFWRHKKTGWEYAPTKDELRVLGIEDRPSLWQSLYEDGFDESRWELLDVAPMAWNRAIVYSSRRFHSRYPRTPFGDSKENGRLLKVFFLNPKSSLRVRRLSPVLDYNEVSNWWEAHKWPTLPIDHLSTLGVIAEDDEWKYAAAWIYKTDSKWGLLEWVVSNPKTPLKKRSSALNYLIETVKKELLALGIETLFTSVKAHGLIRLLEKHGFSVADTGMTNLTLRPGGVEKCAQDQLPR
jgi:hypothetical protein